MAQLQDLKVKISLDNSQFQSGINNIEKQTSSLGASMKKLGGVIAGAFATKAVLDFGKKVASVGMEYNALKETSQTTWTTLLGSQEEAIAQLERIEQFAAKTPFSQMGVDQMAKYLHNAGYEGEAVFDQLTKIGNMGSAFGVQEDALVEMTRQFSQVQQAGVAYTEDLNILADRGIPIYQALAEATGSTVAEVKKMASEGKITAEVYNAAIDSMAATTQGAMDAQSQTFSGMMSTLQDNLTKLAGLLTEQLFNAVKGVLDVFLPLIEAFVQAYAQSGSLSEAFASVLGPALEEMGIKVDGLKLVWETFTNFLNDVYNSMIAPLFDGFREMVGDTAQEFGKNSDSIMNIFENVGDFLSDIWESVIKPVWDAFMEVLFTLWGVFNDNLTNIMNYADNVFKNIKSFWDNILKPVWEKVMEYVGKVWEVFKQYMPEIQRVVDEVFGMINYFWETALRPAFEAIGSFLQNVLFPVFDTVFNYLILPVVETVFDTIISLWDNSLKPIFQGIIDFLGGVFTGDWERIWNGLSGIFGGIWDGMKELAKAPLNFIIKMLNKVIGGLNKVQVPDWVPLVGGKGINIPTIPELWKGSNFTLEGPTLVGEQGPELVNMPRGASVMPAHKTRSVLEGVGRTEVVGRQTANIYVELDGRTLTKVVGANLVDTVRLKTGLSL